MAIVRCDSNATNALDRNLCLGSLRFWRLLERADRFYACQTTDVLAFPFRLLEGLGCLAALNENNAVRRLRCKELLQHQLWL